MNDKELVQAIYTAEYAILEGWLLHIDDAEALRKAADRLEELTQPRPIETAPKDGTPIHVFGGTLYCRFTGQRSRNSNHFGFVAQHRDYLLPKDTDNKRNGWCSAEGVVEAPTHWLPCVKVELPSEQAEPNHSIEPPEPNQLLAELEELNK